MSSGESPHRPLLDPVIAQATLGLLEIGAEFVNRAPHREERHGGDEGEDGCEEGHLVTTGYG